MSRFYGNPEQLKRLKGGVKGWNAWVAEQEKGFRADLYGAVLVGAKLDGARLDGARLNGAKLNGAKLFRAKLAGADLFHADLEGAKLVGAKLEGANVKGAQLKGAKLVSARFNNANLVGAKLEGANLKGAKLDGAKLNSANLEGANLDGAKLDGAKLDAASLEGASLAGANLVAARLDAVRLDTANLNRANLFRATLVDANLGGANLVRANLLRAKLEGTRLDNANLAGANLGSTAIGAIDLSRVKGLSQVVHQRASTVGTSTLELTAAGLDEVDDSNRQAEVEAFCRGAGVEEHLIQYYRGRIGKPIEFYTAFISYSHDPDKPFARRLYNDLQAQGIRCWLDEHDMLIGQRVHDTVDHAIRSRDKVILCCSFASLTSGWVQEELDTTFEVEKQRAELVLLPLDLDGSLFDWTSAHATKVRSRLIADFKGWDKDNARYERELAKLVKALRPDSYT